MAFRDQLVKCKECGKEFVYRVEEQRQQESIGIPLAEPDLCADCRLVEDVTPGLKPGAIKW
ncbi:MAG: zinc-ribbon domain containing protein, partial [Anaerolineae bacterium]|nr:zinc-ribbon domain containing protein [Anaerolineae bacterium]